MAPFLRTGEGGRGATRRGIFKPLLSVGTLFSGALVVALSRSFYPGEKTPGVVCFGRTAQGGRAGARRKRKTCSPGMVGAAEGVV